MTKVARRGTWSLEREKQRLDSGLALVLGVFLGALSSRIIY